MPTWREVQPRELRPRLLELADALPRARVGVIGDVAADIYVSGQTERVSREAPVIVMRYEEQWLRPGCAANAAANVAVLGAKVYLLSLVGQDDVGRDLLGHLQQAGVDTSGVVALPDYRTMTKTRFVAGARSTRRQQVLRLDRASSGYPSKGAQSLLLERLDRLADEVDAWIASDYGLGLMNDAVRERLRQLSGRKVVLADSRYNLLDFHDVTAVKPNQEEALEAVGGEGRGLEGMADVTRRLRECLRVRAALVTLGNQGMMLADGQDQPVHVPPAGTGDIVDLTGAGDTAAAVLAAGVAAGGSFLEAACLANAAGGVVVMKPGAATAGVDEIRSALQYWA